MKFYQCTTEYSCGIDLHARQMYVCVMDRSGTKMLHTNVKGNDFDYFLKRIAPWRDDMTVVSECSFNWYWLADACWEADLTFVLAHALYVKCIHGGKNKNDRLDSEKLCHLLRSNLIPPAYAYPTEKRPVRALLRQRMQYVWKRAELTAHIEMNQLAEGLNPVRQSRRSRDPWEDRLMKNFGHPVHKFSAGLDLNMIRHYDRAIDKIETELHRQAQAQDWRSFNLLKTVPGIGEILALTILYEIDTIDRFPTVKDFCSYCRLVKGAVASAGKIKGLRGAKMGNAYLRWAFGQAAVIAKRENPYLKPYSECLTKKHGKHKANAILANKIARAVYYMLRKGTAFDPELLVATSI